MALEIKITQKGILKKELELKDITGGTLRYGVLDYAWRLQEDTLDGEARVFYDPKHIGRGVEVSWSEDLKEELNLSLPLPATFYDLDMVYGIVERVCKKWGTDSFLQDGVSCEVGDIPKLCEKQKEWMPAFLASNKEKNSAGYGVEILPCVMWPIECDTRMLAEFGETKDMEGFALYLHKHQALDLFYAAPRFYEVGDTKKYLASYVITATCDSIIPMKPEVPFYARSLECNQFIVILVSIEKQEAVGRISYEDFMKAIEIEKLEKFDEGHVIMPELSEERILEIVNQYEDPLG